MDIITNHADQAVGRLLEQFRGSTRLRELVRILIGPLQDLENVFSDLAELRGLDSAFGAQLDGIGQIVDQARMGMSDQDYLTWLKLRIFINVSKARPEDLIHVLKVITQAGQVRYFENHPASVELFTDGLSIPEVGQVKQRVLGLDDGGSLALEDSGNLLVWSQNSRTTPFLVRLMDDLAAGGVGPCPVVISLGELPLAFGADPDMGLLALDDGGEFAFDDGGGLLMNSARTITGSYGEGGHLADLGFHNLAGDDGGYLVTKLNTVLLDQTVSDARVNLLEGNSHVSVPGVDLTDFTEQNYLITLIDSEENQAQGMLGQPGTGETYGDNLLLNGDFDGTENWTTFEANLESVPGGNGNCGKITDLVDYWGVVYQWVNVSARGLYRFSGLHKSGTGNGIITAQSGGNETLFSNHYLSSSDWAQFEIMANTLDGSCRIVLYITGPTASTTYFDTLAVELIQTPATGGAEIVDKDGLSRFSSIDPEFDPMNISRVIVHYYDSSEVLLMDSEEQIVTHGNGRFTEVLQ